MKKRTILVSDILSGHPVTTQESPCSWVALEEARHFLERKRWGMEGTVSVINFDHDPVDGAPDYDYNKST